MAGNSPPLSVPYSQTFKPVSTEPDPPITSDDEDSRLRGTGSGCGLDGDSGFGSGSGECDTPVVDQVKECLADPFVPTTTIGECCAHLEAYSQLSQFK